MAVTEPLCPLRLSNSLPVVVSQTVPACASFLPSGDKVAKPFFVKKVRRF